MYYLGVDGGGTKTSFMIINQVGNVTATYTTSTCHIHQVGFNGFKNILENGIIEVCKKTKISKDDLGYSFLGLPAYGENINDKIKMTTILEEMLGINKFSCGNDIEVALAGSLACSPGICIILGTGAIAAGINNNSELIRTSGWGHICGDEGSGYWIAKKGIEVFGKESDNRLNKTPLYSIFKEKLHINNDFDLIFLIKDEYKEDRTKIAKLAMLVYEAALQGDEYAINIYRQAANECFLMVKGIIDNLGDLNTIKISYAGSVFNSGKLLLEPFKSILDENYSNIELITPILPPIKGAALKALYLHTGIINQDVIQNLSHCYEEVLV